MTTARTVLPTDLVALVSYDGRVFSNEAMTADRTGARSSPHPIETALEQWFSFATGRHTWISVKGATLRGLVSARVRGSKLAWEVDCLIDAATDNSAVLMSLLDQMVEAAGRARVLRVFLRLPRGSFSEQVATRCGFVPYRAETLFRRDTRPDEKHAPSEGLRRRGNADIYGLFQLYNALVPERERRIEALTLNEWRAAQEHLGRTTQYVLEREGRVAALLRIAGDGESGRFDILAEAEALDDAVESALAKLANREHVYTLVGDHDTALQHRLAAAGFDASEEYSVLCRRTVHEAKAKRAVPVGVPKISHALSMRS